MGQEDVVKVLKTNKDWLSSIEIHQQLDNGNTITSIMVSLNKLYKHGIVKRKKCIEYRNGYVYKINNGLYKNENE